MAGINNYYLSRWRHGQMYMDRAEQLVRLAGALGVEIKILVDLACGSITADEAIRIHSGASESPETETTAGLYEVAVSSESGFASFPDAATRKSTRSRRRLLLVISAIPNHRQPLLAALQQHRHVTGLIADNLSLGMLMAERYRPHITFLDLDVAPSMSFEACRVLAGLPCGPRQRNRVVVGAAALTDAATTSSLMAGAAAAYPLPFEAEGFLAELRRLKSAAELGKNGDAASRRDTPLTPEMGRSDDTVVAH